MKISLNCYRPIQFQNNKINNKKSLNENEAYDKIENKNSNHAPMTVDELIQELVDDGMPREEAIFFITTSFGGEV